MNPPPPSRPPASQLPLRLVQLLLGAGLIVALNLLAGLALLAVVPAAKPAAYRLLGLSAFGDVPLWPGLAFLAVLSSALIGLAWRFRAQAWWYLGGGWLAVTPVLIYLAIDDSAVRRPFGVEEVAPSFPGAETSHRLLQRYTRGRPEAEAFQDPGRDLVWPRQGATPADYTAFLEANRAALDAGWSQLAPIRAWYAELAAFERIGDVGTGTFGAEVPLFRVHQSLARLGRAQAGLLTLAGRRDEAVATVLPLLALGRKMQTHARTQTRAMIGLAVRREALRAVALALDHGPLSPALQAQLAAELALGGGGEAGIRRIVATNFAGFAGSMPKLEWGSFFARAPGWRRVLNPLAYFFYNRNRMINEVGALAAEVQELAARRRAEQADNSIAAHFRGPGRPGFKNFIGRHFAADSFNVPMATLISAYWETEDLHAALTQKLASR